MLTSRRLGVDVGLRNYMLRVYNYMAGGLAITGVTAFLIANTSLVNLFFQMGPRGLGLTGLGYVGVFAPLAFVLALSFGVQRMSLGMAQAVFWGYAAVMGISIAQILLLFTGESVARVFFITAATFLAMSVWGYTTKRDLAGFGSFLFMGLIGIVHRQRGEHFRWLLGHAVRDLRDRRARLHRPHRLGHAADQGDVWAGRYRRYRR